ncbi:MAG: hypothetical protein ABSA32_02430 [Candidatus Acidiferrales bacterium]|jgi:hypothetical protein
MKKKVIPALVAAGVLFFCVAFCVAPYPGRIRSQAGSNSNADEEARNQVGKVTQNQIPAAMSGPYHTLADTKRALATADAIFAAYSHIPLLNPPHGFEMLHNVNADARSTPRGWPIPVTSGFILVAYDSHKRLPNGRFATIGEGPVLGGFAMNSIDCDNPSAETDLGRDEISAFYLMPQQTGTVHGWPETAGEVFMTKRTAPRWLPVTAERVLKVQLDKANKTLQDVNAAAPQNAYTQWLAGKDKRMKEYQQEHDEMVKSLGKQQADAYLATMLDTEKKTGDMLASMAQQGSDVNKTASGYQAQASKAVNDLQAQLNSLSPAQRAAPAYVYESPDGRFSVGQVVPAGTPGGVAVVYPNPNFYDRSLPPWEAQSLCVSLSTGPRSRDDPLYPTIVAIWNSLDWDALAQQLK